MVLFKRFFFLGLLLAYTIDLPAQSLQKALDRLVNAPSLKHGEVSCSVMDLASGTTVASHRADKTMIPASAMKVIVTGVALEKLGSDFRFKTELAYSGKVLEHGILDGDLYLKGFGDPTLGSHHFKKAASYETVLRHFEKAICDAGIYEIRGRIIGDARYFDSQVDGRTWVWEDLGNYYGAGAWGLNFHENLYLLDLQQTATLGQAPKVARITPAVPDITLYNELTSTKKGSGDNAYIFGVPYADKRFIRGTIPVGVEIFTIKGAVPDPPSFAAFHLKKHLQEKGVVVHGKAASAFLLEQEKEDLKPAKTFYTYQSPPLKDIVKTTNLKSVNLYCEALLRTLGRQFEGEGSASAGFQVLDDFLTENGLSTDGLFLEDASGLSPRNAVSANHLTQYLAMMKRQKSFELLKASLPVGGQSGALKYLFKGTVAENRVFAKSGGMSRVRSYTGYAQTKSGKWLAFTIIANNFEGKSAKIRRLMEEVMIAMCRS